VDLVGEKLDFGVAARVLDLVEARFSAKPICLVAHRENGAARYFIICREGERFLTEVAQCVEEELSKFHHFRLARELGQLQPSRAVPLGSEATLDRLMSRSGIKGQNKIEPIVEMNIHTLAGMNPVLLNP
jgi:hypothetical protein